MRSDVGFIGLDNWKVVRTAAWAFGKMCETPGKIGTLVRNHRNRCQETNESGFRSCSREYGEGFVLLEPLCTFESAVIARNMTEKLLVKHPDLQGTFISGGGMLGALAALKHSNHGGKIVTVGYELIETTKTGLMDGTLTMVIAHPLQRLATKTLSAMIRAESVGKSAATPNILLPFDIHTSEIL